MPDLTDIGLSVADILAFLGAISAIFVAVYGFTKAWKWIRRTG